VELRCRNDLSSVRDAHGDPGRMNGEAELNDRQRGPAVAAIFWGAIFCGGYYASTYEPETAKRQRADPDAKYERRRQAECKLVNEGVRIATGQSTPNESLSPQDTCETLNVYDCTIRVELLVALVESGRDDLGQQLAAIPSGCYDEYRFARRYGIDAFRAHRKLVQRALVEAEEVAIELHEATERMGGR
jgi:hypothetical protein